MTLFGLHWIDSLILITYIIAVLVIGKAHSGNVKGENDFFLGGRSLGKWFQFFLNFGNMTDPGQATTTASSVYREGAGGAWLALITLFLTPYYWFTNVWFRRVRLTTMADMFQDRFGRRFLATLYAISTLLLAVVGIAGGNVVALKTLQPMMVKPVSAYSAADQEKVAEFHEFSQLKKARLAAALPAEKAERYEVLKGLYDRGELQPYVSYLSPVPFYLVSSLLVAVFVTLGGLKASASVDAVQAVLVIVISLVMIPFGLAQIGGVTGLHAKLPEVLFNVFGGDSSSEYTWYSIGALLLVQLVGIVGSQANMVIAGSAKSEYAARLGVVTGGFSKRFVTIAWCYCGLIAIALFGPNLSDSDQTWGLLTRALLPVGLIGVMIVGILGGKLALLGSNSVVLAGLVAKNLYEPLFPGKPEKHYMMVARLTVPILLLSGIGIALYLNSVVALLKFAIVLLVVWGVPITMIFLWRRLTEAAVRVQVIFTLIFIAVIPWSVPWIPALAQSTTLTAMTRERTVTRTGPATAADITAHRAAALGDPVVQTRVIEPVSIFFEEGVVHVNALDLSSPRTGVGLFRVEVYLLALGGVDVASFGPAGLMTTRYLVDAILPVLLLIAVSLLTRPTEPKRVARFYARMKTPVAPTLEEDARQVEKSYANPTRFDGQKLFPGSNWEFTKWNRQDTLGFLGCCLLVGLILLFFKAVLMVGA